MVKIGPRRRVSNHHHAPVGGPVKKGLLIGINYDRIPEDPEYPALHHARADTKEFAELLIAKYNYMRENVVVLVDEEGGDPRLAPTRANILYEIAKLVQDARSGDHFMFYFSGHSGQVESPTTEEDDGMDEYIVPVDYWEHPDDLRLEKRVILDNKLRKLLVDTLPVGANLTAIFDSCHSGTLLDLDHYLCNNVYFPWISPGFRNHNTLWRRVRRRNDECMSQTGVKVITTKHPRGDRRAKHQSSTGSRTKASTTCSVRIYQRKRVSQDEVLAYDTSVGVCDSDNGKTRQFSVYRQPSRSIKRRKNTTLSMLLEVYGSDISIAAIAQNPDIAEEFDVPMCSSPVDMRPCNGFCEKVDTPASGPSVISLAACGDSQTTWESKHHSFTQRLLEPNPHQPIGQLVRNLTFQLYKHSRKLHTWSKRRRESWKAKQKGQVADPGFVKEGTPDPTLELENFSEPQLGSLRTLTLNEPFNP
ncbi:caspase domain-containing protein [Cubamyces menziesii]|nr:caspase domain-containing protein [Cubamyces menziesii]